MTTLRTGQIAAFPAMRGRPSAVTAVPADPTPAKTERISPDAANAVSRITTDRLFSVTTAMTAPGMGPIAAFPVMRGRPSAVTAVPADPTPAKTGRTSPDAASAVSPTMTGRLSSVTAALTTLRTGQSAVLSAMRGRPSAMTAVPADPTPAKTERISPDAASAVSRITTGRLFLVTAAMTTLRMGPSAALPATRDRPSAVTAVPADPTPAKTGRTSPDAENAVSPTTTDRLSIAGAALNAPGTGQIAALSAMRGHFLTVSVIPEGRICGKTGQTTPGVKNAAFHRMTARPLTAEAARADRT